MKVISSLLILTPLVAGALLARSEPDTNNIWPHPIACRLADGSNKDLFVMTLGDVNPSIADGVYDPLKDEARLKDGTVKSNYYRDTLAIKYFKPVDKSRFRLPPSGWCSWYYYYQEINETEIKRNAEWIGENLKEYGAQYVQIDDGWQGVGRLRTRDWTNTSDKFRGGMDSLASYIKSQGLIPGIWIAPHGQSNEEVVKKNTGVFLLKQDGTSASETWEGRWLVDPSVPETQKYLRDLFTQLSRWGYEYFKIDGQPVVVGEYKSKKPFMKNQPEDPVGAYRQTVQTIRSAIGDNRYLLGCWGIPLEGAGIMNGSRTGGDIVLGWNGGFMTALRATMQHYYLHNVAWYCDPDVMLVRSPLTLDQARAWATLQGLTGQALLSSDRLMDLSSERVEIMRRVYPAADIRPLDLFPSQRNKRIWDLKVNHLGRAYDVVGVFNYDESRAELTQLNWTDLGIAPGGPVHVFDFWNGEYIGAWENGMTVSVSPSSCRVLTLLPDNGRIQLISTSRHITQGWVDLTAQHYDEPRNTWSGTSKLIKGE
ncbi:MAG TPA: alpha-galactosidase, partial [Blastocatellia bacterium]|nr:alpha-galactosidase [Blastocatellia bacterium]